jgi:hypothetical protein
VGGTEEYEKIISWMIANPNRQEVVDHGNPIARNGLSFLIHELNFTKVKRRHGKCNLAKR